jgi:hypothetical protein
MDGWIGYSQFVVRPRNFSNTQSAILQGYSYYQCKELQVHMEKYVSTASTLKDNTAIEIRKTDSPRCSEMEKGKRK